MGLLVCQQPNHLLINARRYKTKEGQASIGTGISHRPPMLNTAGSHKLPSHFRCSVDTKPLSLAPQPPKYALSCVVLSLNAHRQPAAPAALHSAVQPAQDIPVSGFGSCHTSHLHAAHLSK